MCYHFCIGYSDIYLVLDSEQDRRLQAVVLDRVHRANRPERFL